MYKKLALGLMVGALLVTVGCGDDKKPAADPKKPATTTQAPAKKEKIRLYTDEQLKKMTPAERAKARKEEYLANLTPEERRAAVIADKPESKKFSEQANKKFPHLTFGSVGYNFSKQAVDGEVVYHYRRSLDPKKAPVIKDEKTGRDLKGQEAYNIHVLYGACKGQCVIEAKDEHVVKMDAVTLKTPKVEETVLVPFDKTYIRHEENGKKWVTHEKCGTK